MKLPFALISLAAQQEAAALTYLERDDGIRGAPAAPAGPSFEWRFGHRARAPEPRFLRCLADVPLGAEGASDPGAIFRRCLAASQSQCRPERTLKVCAHLDAGFGAGVHTWVMSFAYALEHDLTWLPVGPWAYAEPESCPGSDPGQECFFEKVSNCTDSSLHTVCANIYSRLKHQTVVIQAAELLGVSRAWVWGHLLAHILQMRPAVARLVEQRVPRSLSKGTSAVLHVRVGTNMTGEDDPSWGRSKESVEPYVAGLDRLTQKIGASKPSTVYVMTDDPGLNEVRLRELAPGVPFIRPARAAVDLSKARPESTPAHEVVYDLLADVEAAVHADVFIGTISNLFWLVYALKQTRQESRGVACWLDTVRKKSFDTLVCPWDQGFYWHGPRGLTSHPTEEFQARLRAGDSPDVAKERASQSMTWRNGRGPCWECEDKTERNRDMWGLFKTDRRSSRPWSAKRAPPNALLGA